MAKLANITETTETTTNELDFSQYEKVSISGKKAGHIFTFNTKQPGDYAFDLGNPYQDKKGRMCYWAYQGGNASQAVGWLYLSVSPEVFRKARKNGQVVIGISRDWNDLD